MHSVTERSLDLDLVSSLPGETISCGGECWSVDAIVDQALAVAADHQADLAGLLGVDAERPSPDRLRRSPLGRDLLLLADAACERGSAAHGDLRAAILRVHRALLGQAASDDIAAPPWFRDTALGRLLSRAERRAHGEANLLDLDTAAAHLGVDRTTARRWVDDRRLPAVWDETGAPLVPMAAVQARQDVARELTPALDRVLDHQPTRSAAD